MNRNTNTPDADAILDLIQGKARRGLTVAQLAGEMVDRWDMDR